MSNKSNLAINDLIDKIYHLNDIKDEFWQGYLSRISNNIKVTWHHSSGFDLRPLAVVNGLTIYYSRSDKLRISRYIGRELQKTEFVFNDSWNRYYDIFLDLWNKKQHGGLNESDVSQLHEHYSGIPSVESMLSIVPFRLFSNEERKALKSLDFMCRCYKENRIEENREFDGFAIKFFSFSSSYITIIFLCLDDRIVKKIFDDYNIDVICIFENTAGGGEGGSLSLDCLYNTSEEMKNVKYIFTDRYFYDDEKKRLKLGYNFLNDDYYVSNYMHECFHKFYSVCYSEEDVVGYGRGFGLASRKTNMEENLR